MFTINVTTLDSLTLVISFLSLTEGDDELDISSSGQKFGRHDGHAIFFASSEYNDLFVTGKEFARCSVDSASTRIASLVELEAEARVIEPKFPIFDGDERTLELDVPVARGSNFRTCQHKSGDDFIAKFIIEPRPSVDDGPSG